MSSKQEQDPTMQNTNTINNKSVKSIFGSNKKVPRARSTSKPENIDMNELGLSLPLPTKVASKRRITSQDWMSSRDLNYESPTLPSNFSFNDISAEDNPLTSALQSYSEFSEETTSKGDVFSDSQRSLWSNCSSELDALENNRVTTYVSPVRQNDVPVRYETQSKVSSETEKTFCIPTELDVLLGRGGLTNNHSGNIRYREEVEKTKSMYFACRTKNEKKEVSELLVAYVEEYGGRFLEKDPETKQWVLASAQAARKKASQALRETKWKQSKMKQEEKPG